MPDWLYIAFLVLLVLVAGVFVLLALAGRQPAQPDECQDCGHSMDDHQIDRYTSHCEAKGCGCEEYRPNLGWVERELRA